MGISGGKTGAELTAFLDHGRDQQPILERCARCTWEYAGCASDGRDAFAVHVASVHPEVRFRRGSEAVKVARYRLRAAERAALLAERRNAA